MSAGLAALGLGGAALRLLGIANTVQTAVGNMPLPDDAFYYLVLARNVARGRGWVISGSGEPTTGFQPLWGALLAAVESLTGGLTDAARITAAQLLGAGLGLVAAAVLYRLGRRLAPGSPAALVACAAFLLSPQVVRHNLNGMETSLAFLGLLALLYLFVLTDPSWLRARDLFLAGAAGGLCVLARFDLAILLACGLTWWAVSPAFGSAAARVGRLALIGAGIGAVLAPWLAFGLGSGHSFVPESGRAVRTLTLLLRGLPPLGPLESLREGLDIFGPLYLNNAVEFTSAWVRQTPLLLPLTLPVFVLLTPTQAEAVSAGVGVVAVAAVIVLAARGGDRRLHAAVGLWTAYAAGMTMAYSVFVLGPWFFQRYVAPLAVGFHLLLLVVGLKVAGDRLRGPWPAAGALGAIALSFGALMWLGSYRWIAAGRPAVPDDGFYRAAEYVEAVLPGRARLGVFSAGLLSYYLEQPVVSLDGKVDGGARQALEQGEMFAYLCSERVDYVVDWERMIDRLLRRRTAAWDEAYLRPVHVVEVEAGNDILIYEVDRRTCGV